MTNEGLLVWDLSDKYPQIQENYQVFLICTLIGALVDIIYLHNTFVVNCIAGVTKADFEC